MSSPIPPTTAQGQATNPREVLTALSGLLLGLLMAILSSTIVSTALPTIIADLKGTQSAYTWVIISTLLAMTVTTPVWGKLSDIADRKRLVQLALVIFTVGSVLAGFAQSTGWLIACRAIQGIGVGGLTALTQVVIADLISPRERGRYMGILGAVMSVGTVAGPLIGGVITDSIGWRWCFFVGVPICLLAIVVLQRTLHLAPRERPERVHIDLVGATLIAAGVSALLIWVSLAGNQFDWVSGASAGLVVVGIALLVAAVWTEHHVTDPLIDLRLFNNRTLVLGVIASVAVGVAMFGTSTFLSQYLQLAKGKSPTSSGLLTIPMVVGTMISSIVIGQRISATGKYKRWMMTGGVLMTVGFLAMGLTLDETTSLIELAVFMLIIGLGIGMTMQNLVLVVQNSVSYQVIGSASALIAFFRTMAGAMGVSVLGAVLSHVASGSITDGLARLGADPASSGQGGGTLPKLSTLPGPVRDVVEHAYGAGIGDIFLIAAPAALVALIAISFIPETPLRTQSGAEMAREEAAMAASVDPVASEIRDHNTEELQTV